MSSLATRRRPSVRLPPLASDSLYKQVTSQQETSTVAPLQTATSDSWSTPHWVEEFGPLDTFDGRHSRFQFREFVDPVPTSATPPTISGGCSAKSAKVLGISPNEAKDRYAFPGSPFRRSTKSQHKPTPTEPGLPPFPCTREALAAHRLLQDSVLKQHTPPRASASALCGRKVWKRREFVLTSLLRVAAPSLSSSKGTSTGRYLDFKVEPQKGSRQGIGAVACIHCFKLGGTEEHERLILTSRSFVTVVDTPPSLRSPASSSSSSKKSTRQGAWSLTVSGLQVVADQHDGSKTPSVQTTNVVLDAIGTLEGTSAEWTLQWRSQAELQTWQFVLLSLIRALNQVEDAFRLGNSALPSLLHKALRMPKTLPWSDHQDQPSSRNAASWSLPFGNGSDVEYLPSTPHGTTFDQSEWESPRKPRVQSRTPSNAASILQQHHPSSVGAMSILQHNSSIGPRGSSLPRQIRDAPEPSPRDRRRPSVTFMPVHAEHSPPLYPEDNDIEELRPTTKAAAADPAFAPRLGAREPFNAAFPPRRGSEPMLRETPVENQGQTSLARASSALGHGSKDSCHNLRSIAQDGGRSRGISDASRTGHGPSGFDPISPSRSVPIRSALRSNSGRRPIAYDSNRRRPSDGSLNQWQYSTTSDSERQDSTLAFLQRFPSMRSIALHPRSPTTPAPITSSLYIRGSHPYSDQNFFFGSTNLVPSLDSFQSEYQSGSTPRKSALPSQHHYRSMSQETVLSLEEALERTVQSYATNSQSTRAAGHSRGISKDGILYFEQAPPISSSTGRNSTTNPMDRQEGTGPTDFPTTPSPALTSPVSVSPKTPATPHLMMDHGVTGSRESPPQWGSTQAQQGGWDYPVTAPRTPFKSSVPPMIRPDDSEGVASSHPRWTDSQQDRRRTSELNRRGPVTRPLRLSADKTRSFETLGESRHQSHPPTSFSFGMLRGPRARAMDASLDTAVGSRSILEAGSTSEPSPSIEDEDSSHDEMAATLSSGRGLGIDLPEAAETSHPSTASNESEQSHQTVRPKKVDEASSSTAPFVLSPAPATKRSSSSIQGQRRPSSMSYASLPASPSSLRHRRRAPPSDLGPLPPLPTSSSVKTVFIAASGHATQDDGARRPSAASSQTRSNAGVDDDDLSGFFPTPPLRFCLRVSVEQERDGRDD